MAKQRKKKRGPEPDRLKIELDPNEAIRRLVKPSTKKIGSDNLSKKARG